MTTAFSVDQRPVPGRQPPPDETDNRRAAAGLAAALWRVSTSYTVLLGTAAVTLVLITVALSVPQLPSQLQSSPAAANRWLLAARAQYGTLGSLLGALGLFDLLHNPAFRLLLAALLYLLAMQTARLLGIALALRNLSARIHQAVDVRGDPIPLPPVLGLARRRVESATTGDAIIDAATMQLEPRYAQLIYARSAPEQADENDGEEADARSSDGPQAASRNDRRLLALNAPRVAFLRPLATLGLALAVAGLWVNAQQGWDVTVPPLAAGDTYRHPPRDLEIAYMLDDSAENLSVALQITLGNEEITLPVSASVSARIGDARVRADADTPGVVIRTQPAQVTLAQPGEPATSAAIGLSFPMVASEESLLIPDEAVGIRLVRLPRSEELTSPFIVELYDASQTAAAQSARLDLTDIEIIAVEDSDIKLELTPVPGLSISLRSAPGTVLIWLGLALALAGTAGWLRRSRFVLVQTAPWSDETSVVTLQSNAGAELDALLPRIDPEDAA